MDLKIIEKGHTLDLDIASKIDDSAPKSFYMGAGWDNPNGPVDLDIVAVLLGADGKLSGQENLIYFGNRTAPGVQLSEDNTTGEGEGDDESIVFTTADIDSSIQSIVVGLAAYAGADFGNAPNPHFRACDGAEERSEQIADIPMGDGESGDTVLTCFRMDRNTEGHWVMTNIAAYYKCGTGQDAIKGFAELDHSVAKVAAA